MLLCQSSQPSIYFTWFLFFHHVMPLLFSDWICVYVWMEECKSFCTTWKYLHFSIVFSLFRRRVRVHSEKLKSIQMMRDVQNNQLRDWDGYILNYYFSTINKQMLVYRWKQRESKNRCGLSSFDRIHWNFNKYVYNYFIITHANGPKKLRRKNL